MDALYQINVQTEVAFCSQIGFDSFSALEMFNLIISKEFCGSLRFVFQ